MSVIPDAPPPPHEASKRAELRLSYAAENRKSEIALLWSRSLYFWGFITVVLVAYGGAIQHQHMDYALLASCFGIISSLCWTLTNRASKYWQRVWEIKTQDFAYHVVGEDVFPRSSNPKFDERWFWGSKQYSPSKLATAVSDLTVVTWLVLAGAAVSKGHLLFDLLAVILTTVYALVILIWCRSGDPLTVKEATEVIFSRFTWMFDKTLEFKARALNRKGKPPLQKS